MNKLKIGLALVNDKKMQELNKKYRKIDEPTDVLSFPHNEDLSDGTYFLGEVVVNVDEVKGEEAIIERIVHGTKNLLKNFQIPNLKPACRQAGPNEAPNSNF